MDVPSRFLASSSEDPSSSPDAQKKKLKFAAFSIFLINYKHTQRGGVVNAHTVMANVYHFSFCIK